MNAPTMSRFVMGAILLSALTGCAHHYTQEAIAEPYGFFSGLWHWLVWPYALCANIVSWLLSLLDISLWRDIELIGRPNTGFFYYVGFALGLFSYGGAGATR